MWLDECRELCRRAKYVGEEVIWRTRDNHAGALYASAVMLDLDRVVISGLQFQGEVQNRRYGPYQKYSLMISKGGRRLRVFALEVMPVTKRSHIEDGLEIFGPHVQLGDEREDGLSHVARRVACNLDERSVNGWIRRFQRYARVYDGDDFPLIPPFANDLFGL
ncbi:hypothetical protein [Xanthomonas sacchari]|uniref:hypothetical protein n=1 Tax=Xanthomonas sacchari TaxID=56458 RepID=UPI0022510847|nr:hypothetical protein [Xanthomonas sacchari]MCW0457279.1 hypothetical protein [Xanthomonas sacchari]